MDDEDRPLNDGLFTAPSNDQLARLSVGELEERISFLKHEIARTEQMLASKGSAKNAAESFFKS